MIRSFGRLALAALLALASTVVFAQGGTTLWYEFVPGSYGTAGSHLYQQGTDTFNITKRSPGAFELQVTTPGYNVASLSLAPPVGTTFAPGAYEGTQASYYSPPYAPALTFYGPGISCYPASGRFVILELALDSNFDIATFALDFEVRCTDNAVVYGELRMGSSIPLTMNKPASASTPDAFAFRPRNDVAPGAVLVSETTTIYGTRAPAAVSIVGGEYSINGGAFTTAPGTASNRDRIAVRLTASSAYSTTRTATLTVGGVAAPFNVTTFTPGAPFTALLLESESDHYAAYLYGTDLRAPEWRITASHEQGKSVTIQGSSTAGSVYISLKAPLDLALAAGPYEDAYTMLYRGASPGISLGGGLSCSVSGGRFVVHELVLGSAPSTVERFAASFEAWCDYGEPVFGEIRINSARPLPWMVVGPDTTPDPFALNAQSPVRAGALVLSNLITVSGVSAPVPVSITGGLYSLNGAAYTSAPGTAQPRDDIRVQLIASPTAGAVSNATLTVGGQSATLSVTTYAPGMALTGLYYRSTSGDAAGQGQTRLYLAPPNGFTAYGSAHDVNVAVAAARGAQGRLVLAAAGYSTPMSPGTYEGARRYGYSSAPTLDFSTGSSSCYEVAGRFVVHEWTRNPDGTAQRLAADFEQRCEGSTAPLLGEVRFNSTVPFSALTSGTCVIDCANLSVTQTASANPASTGKDVVLTMTATNLGPAAANGVTLTASYDATAEVIWVSPGCVKQDASLVYACAAGTLTTGATGQFKLVLRKNSSGSMSVNASVSSATQDSDASNNSASLTIPVDLTPPGVPVLRYRLYSPASLEHHFTTDLNEYTVLGASGAWVQEGTVGKVLNNPLIFNGITAVPYYRLYNTFTLWHHWTTDPNEYYTLVTYPGWNGEGVDGYILPTPTAGATQLYRLVYPNGSGLHHWTVDANEYTTLIGTYGWVGEGGAGYVLQ